MRTDRQIMALHAAISRRDWHAVEVAANDLRDHDAALREAEARGRMEAFNAAEDAAYRGCNGHAEARRAAAAIRAEKERTP